MTRMTRRHLLCGTAALMAPMLPITAMGRPALGKSFRDPTLPIAERVSDLLSQMTLDEKVAQMRSLWQDKKTILGRDGAFSQSQARKAIPHGIGQIARPHDRAGTADYAERPFRDIADTVSFVNAVQRYLVEKTRLGIPALFHEEGAHGLLARGSTIFPIPPGIASTWDPGLAEQIYTVTAREIRVRGGTIALSPVVDLMREPRFGRSEEFYSEDPYLTAQMGIAAVRGFQGRRRPLGPDRVFATLKHFVHAAPQGGLNLAPADLSERSLRETYLVPFAEIVRQADPAIIMPSYNEVEGVPSHASVDLLQSTGRRRLGFRGAYMSDYGGIGNLMEQHHIAASKDDAAVLAMNAGVAADLPEGESYRGLADLVRAGRISEAQLDAAVASILALKFEAGLFEHPYVDPARAQGETNTQASIALARTAAEKALILLKNDGTLPLEPTHALRLALIGPNSVEPLFGGYSGENAKAVGILEGLRRAAPAYVTIEQADGVWITPPDKEGRHYAHSRFGEVQPEENRARITQAIELADRCDVIVLVVGDVPAVTREAVGAAYRGDRSSLGLWGQQDELVEAMIATGKPIIALLINGRPLAVNRLAEKANALIEGWYLGQEGGNAFADVLFGKANPGGKLTVSIPRSVGELPVFYDRHPSSDINEYLEGRRTPLFPFGHGLSYTTFDLSAPRPDRARVGRGETVRVEVDITNTGKRAGDEVVQLYIRDEVSSVPRPVLELRRFERLRLAAGEKRTITFELQPDDLAFWDIDMKWTVEPGDFTILCGPSSAQLKSAQLTVAA